MNSKKQIKTIKETEQSAEELAQLSEMSDEKNTQVAPKFSLASLKLNGRDGSFFRTVLDSGGSLKVDENTGKALLVKVESPSGVILRPRKSFNFVGPDYQLFTSESGNTAKSVFSVFRKQETKKGFSTQIVGQGTPAEIKAKFPELKMTSVLFFLMNGEIFRLKIKGLSLGNLFSYWKEFSNQEHFFQYLTQLGEEKQKNQFGKFVVCTFTKGARISNLEEVKSALKLVNDNINSIDNYYAERNQEIAEINEEESKMPREKADLETNEEGDEIVASIKKNGAGVKQGPTKPYQTSLDEDGEIDVENIPF